MNSPFADKIKMQHLLFAELSNMFGKEVPLYDKSLLVNKICNQAVCEFLSKKYVGFALSDEQLAKTSGERHGAIRIGRPDEYRLVTGFFAAFGMEPHNFYDMTNVGSKSQPIVATAFRSRLNPEHRIFCSLLMTDYFDPQTRGRIETLLSKRQVFSERAKELIGKNESDGGLSWNEAEELIREGTKRIFKWTGEAQDFGLYQELSQAGFKIAADIACFQSHHLNHLTPNTLCMDLFTASMKFCLGELTLEAFKKRAKSALTHLLGFADRDFMRLHFRHLSSAEIESFTEKNVSADEINRLTETTAGRLQEPDCVLTGLKHSGFKDFTEGPAHDTPVLLRQDAYKALTEPVTFHQPDGSKTESAHTARFGEIEQRFYATTPTGRELYDKCLAAAEATREKDPGLVKRDYEGYQRNYAQCFVPFPKKLSELLSQKLVYGRFCATEKGRHAAVETGSIKTADLGELLNAGYVQAEGLRYEDFLPVSAAGIFASNLGQYGTKSTAPAKPTYSAGQLEEIMGRKIVDSTGTYKGLEAASLLKTYSDLNLLDRVPSECRSEWETAASRLS